MNAGKLTVRKAAVQYDVSESILRKAIKRQELASTRIGDRGWIYLDPVDVAAWLETHRVTTQPHDQTEESTHEHEHPAAD